MFFDYENLALAFRSQFPGQKPDLNAIMSFAQSVCESEKVHSARAYADWSHFTEDRQAVEALQIEPLQVDAQPVHGKNATDILMAVDMIDMLHDDNRVETYILITGDSDFAPVVQRLRDHGKRVIGIGVRGSVSARLREACTEFHDYESLLTSKPSESKSVAKRAPRIVSRSASKPETPRGHGVRDTLRLVDGYTIPSARLKQLLPLVSEAYDATRPQHIAEMRKGLSLRYPGEVSAQETAMLANLLYAIGGYGGKSAAWLGDERLRNAQFAFDLLLAAARDTLSETERKEVGGLPQLVEMITGENLDRSELQMRLTRGKNALADLRGESNGKRP